MPKDGLEDDLATGIATGALPIHRIDNAHQAGVDDFDRSWALVPASLSKNPKFEFATRFFGAGIASMFSAVATNPFDIIKVRQQLHTESAASIWMIAKHMAQREGFRSLMNGTTGSIAREGTYSTIRLGTYEVFKDLLKSHTSGVLDPDGLTLKVTASVIAGTIGSAVANPTDLAKIRMQAYYPSGRPYRSLRHAFASIYREGGGSLLGGATALYRGVLPTVVRGWTIAACQMPAYDHTKQYLKRHEIFTEGVSVHIAASSVAGLACSLASNPVDVIKVRLMDDRANRYRGITHCVSSVLTNEGPLAFYKGFAMCWARLGSHTIITYMIYEQLRLLAGVKPL